MGVAVRAVPRAVRVLSDEASLSGLRTLRRSPVQRGVHLLPPRWGLERNMGAAMSVETKPGTTPKVTLLTEREISHLSGMSFDTEGIKKAIALARWAAKAHAWMKDHHSGHMNECDDPDCDIGALLAEIEEP
jgi:hypothetical protein